MPIGHTTKETKALFGFFFSSLNFHHSISITRHLKYPTRLAPSLTCHHSIFFTLFVGLKPVTRCSFFLIQPPVPKLTEPSEEKRKKERKKELKIENIL